MDPLLFADHLRILRETEKNRPGQGPATNLAGAGSLLVAACVACLLVVMLQSAFSRPLELFPDSERIAKTGTMVVREAYFAVEEGPGD